VTAPPGTTAVGKGSGRREPISALEHQTGMKTLCGLLLVVATLVLVSGPATAASPTCHGVHATIVGTRHHDKIVGTSHRDVIVAGRGDDVVQGRGGNDLICGGPGADRLEGGPGRDRLYGEGDFINHGEAEACDHGDSLDGGGGDDVLDPGRDPHAGYFEGCSDRDEVRFQHGRDHGVHVDLVRGTATGQGHDRIVTGYGLSVVGSDRDDVILGSDFPEVFNARAGKDIVRARGGDDEMIEGKYANGNDLYDAGDGEDLVITTRGHDTVLGGADDDQMILLNPPAMTVDGGDGDDQISRYAVPGGQTVTGGAGTDGLDIILHDSPGPQAELDIPAGTITIDGVSSGVSGFELWNFVSYRPLLVHGSDAGESVRADGWDSDSDVPLTAYMGGGDDTVEGGASDDYVDGGDGTDTANLGGGTNTCVDVEQGGC
jgi:Ca2+-binding RTX toxin-like protein